MENDDKEESHQINEEILLQSEIVIESKNNEIGEDSNKEKTLTNQHLVNQNDSSNELKKETHQRESQEIKKEIISSQKENLSDSKKHSAEKIKPENQSGLTKKSEDFQNNNQILIETPKKTDKKSSSKENVSTIKENDESRQAKKSPEKAKSPLKLDDGEINTPNFIDSSNKVDPKKQNLNESGQNNKKNTHIKENGLEKQDRRGNALKTSLNEKQREKNEKSTTPSIADKKTQNNNQRNNPEPQQIKPHPVKQPVKKPANVGNKGQKSEIPELPESITNKKPNNETIKTQEQTVKKTDPIKVKKPEKEGHEVKSRYLEPRARTPVKMQSPEPKAIEKNSETKKNIEVKKDVSKQKKASPPKAKFIRKKPEIIAEKNEDLNESKENISIEKKPVNRKKNPSNSSIRESGLLERVYDILRKDKMIYKSIALKIHKDPNKADIRRKDTIQANKAQTNHKHSISMHSNIEPKVVQNHYNEKKERPLSVNPEARNKLNTSMHDENNSKRKNRNDESIDRKRERGKIEKKNVLTEKNYGGFIKKQIPPKKSPSRPSSTLFYLFSYLFFNKNLKIMKEN